MRFSEQPDLERFKTVDFIVPDPGSQVAGAEPPLVQSLGESDTFGGNSAPIEDDDEDEDDSEVPPLLAASTRSARSR